jgi:1-acyl-sn-glycerol-3-phosphate acyltransferase
MNSTPRVSSRLYWFSHFLLRVAYAACFRGKIAGRENLPATGGYFIASNHASYLDPPIVGLFVPAMVTFFARNTLWRRRLFSWWLDRVGCIPVERDGGADVGAIKRVLRAVEDGRIVILFPEGTRTRDGGFQRPKAGVGLLACRSGAPVVPARIFGSFKALGRKGGLRLGTPISVVYGKPLLPADYDPGDIPGRYAIAADRIMEAIARLALPQGAVDQR